MATPTDIRLGKAIAIERLGGGSGSYQEYRNTSAFAAIKTDGSVVTWGLAGAGGDSSGVDVSSDVSEVFSSTRAFAALKTDGSVVTWGDAEYGGDSNAVAAQLSTGVVKLFSSDRAFAALKEDGSIVTWGEVINNWFLPSSFHTEIDALNVDFSSGVREVYSSESGFSAATNNGYVVTWGNDSVIDSSDVDFSGGITSISSSGAAFAAIKNDGSAVTWGNSAHGGDSSQVDLSGGVRAIASNEYAFAALKEDGSVTTWGGGVIASPFGGADFFSTSEFGGDSSAVADQLTSGVDRIYATRRAFAALKEDGSVVTWGNGGGGNSSGVDLLSGVKEIFSSSLDFQEAFAALKEDGSVVTWGDAIAGGDSRAVSNALASGVSAIFSTDSAFAALKDDGSIVTWGNPEGGGDSSAVVSQLSSGVVQIVANGSAFTAIKADGSVVTWGNSEGGGDSSAVASQLASGVVAVSSPFDNDFSAVSEVDENIAAGSTLANLRTIDSDINDSFSYSLVSGIGSNDNSVFTIDGDQLIINDSPDYETQSSYSIRIRTTDQSGDAFEKVFNIGVNNLDEDNSAPTEVTLSNNIIGNFLVPNGIVGTFGTLDADSTDDHSYTLVAGEGDEDYRAFTIDGNLLRINESPDFAQSSYAIRVQSDDGRGGTVEHQLTITIDETLGILGAGAMVETSNQRQDFSALTLLNFDQDPQSFITEELIRPRFFAPNLWSLEAMGDLNGDGQDDILARHADAGFYLVYYVAPEGDRILPGNDGQADGDLFGRTVSDPNWEIVGAGDIDLDGNEDVILRNTIADQTIAWYLDGNGNILSEGLVGREIGDSSWSIDAVADFDGDGQSDFLLRDYESGQILLWKMDRGVITEESLFGRDIADLNWHIEGAKDFNRDGITDVFLRHRAAGVGLIWQMSNSQNIASEIVVGADFSSTAQLVF